jgi:iron-sulfur cluster repair protein YtfE (RIC family)
MKTIEPREQAARRAIPLTDSRQTPRAKPILKLELEHESILNQSRTLIEALTHIRGNKDQSVSERNLTHHLAKLEQLLSDHFTNEERIVVPVMSEYFDPEAVAAIREEHARLLTTLKRLTHRGPEPKRIPSRKHTKASLRATTDFDSMLRAHFSQEENVTYWFTYLHLG